MVVDPQTPVSPTLELEGGTITHMAPELLAPSEYGLKNTVPTQESDVYAFVLVILQAFASGYRHLLVFS